MDAATKVTVETSEGLTEEFVCYKDVTISKKGETMMIKRGLADQIRDVINFRVKEGDVFLASFPKTGTHWAWEVMCMLVQGSADYIETDKEFLFLDLINPSSLNDLPSPRVLNSHFTPRCIPREIVKKGIKIVNISRNAKDVLVSLYHHLQALDHTFTKNFDTFFKFFTGSYGIYHFCSWAHYMKEWEYFSKLHPDQILNLRYEDMKEDTVREIKKINEFLKCNRGDELIQDIADACSFANLKKANQNKSHAIPITSDRMYRKGEVGDWKNWFTAAQNEQMDQWLEENFSNTEMKFRYTL